MPGDFLVLGQMALDLVMTDYEQIGSGIMVSNEGFLLNVCHRITIRPYLAYRPRIGRFLGRPLVLLPPYWDKETL
ncbi:hypothetical protein FRC18_000307 [Serendipita sp. 400]|nr:hypothetical protein FRC18_000307 [Serendipita sp. 400]